MVSVLGFSKHSETAVTDDALGVPQRASRMQPAYSAIEHIAPICCLQNWRDALMAMLTTGFDVSYDEPKKRFLVMCGFLSDAEVGFR